jgi:GT2 family glycosyltransferase
MDLSIVVVNYQSDADTQRFLRSLEENAPDCQFSVMRVNVGTAPFSGLWPGYRMSSFPFAPSSTWDLLSGTQNGRGMQLDINENVGYARACNMAAALVDGEILGLFNADTAFLPGTLDAVLAAFDANGRWGVVGPKQVNDRGEITHAGIFGTHRAPAHRGWREQDRGQYEDTLEAITVSGSAYFVRRAAWQELSFCRINERLCREAPAAHIGAFLPTMHYYEETWCSYHAAAHDWKVMYFGEAKMLHQWHQASPVGGWAEQQMPVSRQFFRRACDEHSILCD